MQIVLVPYLRVWPQPPYRGILAAELVEEEPQMDVAPVSERVVELRATRLHVEWETVPNDLLALCEMLVQPHHVVEASRDC